MAREVQLRLLPSDAPSHPHAEMAVRFLPARTIGGDLYDFVDYGPGRTAIVLSRVAYMKRFARDSRVGFGL